MDFQIRLKKLLLPACAALLSICIAVAAIKSKTQYPERGSWKQPNFVFVTFDTLRADHTPFGGYIRSTMPHTASFFRYGINFRQAITVRSRTTAAYASLFSGLYPHHTGVRNLVERLDSSIPTIQKRLRQHGYVTAGFVSSFVMIGRLNGFHEGFDVYDDWVDERRATTESYERRAHRTIPRVLNWLNNRPKQRPFFLFLHLIDPHGPYDPPGNIRFHSKKVYELNRPQIPRYQHLKGLRNFFDYVDRYDSEIRFADQQLKPLYDAFEQIKENTWFIFTADHGESLGDHGDYFQHGNSCYESQIRIPFVLLPPPSPKTEQAKAVNTPVSLVDILPTIEEIARLPRTPKLDGESLLPLIRGGSGRERFQFCEKVEDNEKIYAARASRMKLIWRLHSGNSYELFDMEIDPSEKKNLLGGAEPVPSALKNALQGYVEDAENYKTPFTVMTFPKELQKAGASRTKFIQERVETLSAQDLEKLKALGYVN